MKPVLYEMLNYFKEKGKKDWKNMNNKMAINTLSTITLNANEWISSIKRHSGWMGNKTQPLSMLPTRDSLQTKGHTQTESQGMEKIFHENGNKK